MQCTEIKSQNLFYWFFWLIDWLLGFNARAAIFQLYPGDEREMNDKMNMKWWWNEKEMGHKENGVDKFWLLSTGNSEKWVEPGNFSSLLRSPMVPTPIETTEWFFNVRETWHISQHVAPLWFAVRFSILWPDDPHGETIFWKFTIHGCIHVYKKINLMYCTDRLDPLCFKQWWLWLV